MNEHKPQDPKPGERLIVIAYHPFVARYGFHLRECKTWKSAVAKAKQAARRGWNAFVTRYSGTSHRREYEVKAKVLRPRPDIKVRVASHPWA